MCTILLEENLEKMLKKNKFRKWVVDHMIDPWLPVNKRKLLKNKMFEMNTSKQKQPVDNAAIPEEQLQQIKTKLREFYLHDTMQLDELLRTNFYSKWFGHNVIPIE